MSLTDKVKLSQLSKHVKTAKIEKCQSQQYITLYKVTHNKLTPLIENTSSMQSKTSWPTSRQNWVIIFTTINNQKLENRVFFERQIKALLGFRGIHSFQLCVFVSNNPHAKLKNFTYCSNVCITCSTFNFILMLSVLPPHLLSITRLYKRQDAC